MEWVEGWSVREVLGGGQEGDELAEEDELEESSEEAEDVQEMLRGKGVDPGEWQCGLESWTTTEDASVSYC